ncbi:MAG: hypothetical protein A2017_11900 [Lentisphaerae bacterium GWF2_44_16]|nr:MAG: hypothetical protein A2017_11900 [Lentisphaerae bacterium GWF2_44_16]
MLIKCLNCNHENQLGSIFCRSCGQKLDIEAVRPELKDDKKTGIFKVLRKIITIVILLSVLGVLAGLFIPYGFKKYEALTEEAQTKAKDTYDAMIFRIDGVGRKKEFTFSLPELTYLFNNVITAATGDSSVTFDSDGKDGLFIISESKLYNTLPLRMELAGNLSENMDADENDMEKIAFSFNITGAKFGHVPMPGFMISKLAEKFKPLLESETISKILKAIFKAQLNEDGNLLVVLKKIPKPVKK